jgi:hypothetical protein
VFGFSWVARVPKKSCVQKLNNASDCEQKKWKAFIQNERQRAAAEKCNM